MLSIALIIGLGNFMCTAHEYQNDGLKKINGSTDYIRNGNTNLKVEIDRKVTHGKKAVPGQFPSMASVINLKTFSHVCGAAILDPYWVISAAHCFDDKSLQFFNFKIQVGSLNIDYSPSATIDVDRVFILPKYLEMLSKNVDDLALVRLTTPITFTDNVTQANISPYNYVDYKEVQVAGFGDTHNYGSPKYLKYIKMGVPSVKKCFQKFPLYAHIGIFCIGYDNMTSRILDGDSGSGMWGLKNNKVYLVGITSFRFLLRRWRTYSFAVNVYDYKDWVTDTMAASPNDIMLVAKEAPQDYTWSNKGVAYADQRLKITCETSDCKIQIKSIWIENSQNGEFYFLVRDQWYWSAFEQFGDFVEWDETTKWKWASKSIGYVSPANTAVAYLRSLRSSLITFKLTYVIYNSATCAEPANKCNQVNDCPDMEDELGCLYPKTSSPSDTAAGCYPSDFICQTNYTVANVGLCMSSEDPSECMCLRKERLCNKHADCKQEKDENKTMCALISSVNSASTDLTVIALFFIQLYSLQAWK